ncbi:MAG: hypothetical protein ACE5FZ_05030 [Nitrospiria bacterium]
MKRFLFVFTGTLLFVSTSAFAAPIGVPGATVGTNNSRITAELNLLSDRDLNVPDPADPDGREIESRQLILKGEVGLNKRVDLNIRFGFGSFEVSPGIVEPNQISTDNGPLFGLGLKATLAKIPDTNIKVGTVVQTLRMRGEQDGGVGAGPGDLDGTRHAFTEYDLAVGAYYTPPKSRGKKKRKKEFVLLPYGGLVWSGVEIDGAPKEDDTFGLFVGTVVKTGGKVQYGIELRIPDQTALSFSASFPF